MSGFTSTCTGVVADAKVSENLQNKAFSSWRTTPGANMSRWTTTRPLRSTLGESTTLPVSEKEARMYSTSNDQFFDGLNCLKMYLQKINPRCEALFQYPKRAATQEDQVWYDNKPLGVNRLAGMMKELSKLASLSKIYTNHSVRATAITLWSDAQVPSRHTIAISGHRSEASLRNYNARPSSEQLRACSDILSGALNGRSQESQRPSFTEAVTSSSFLPMNPTPTVVHSRNTAQQFVKYQPQALSSLFSNCQVNNVQVFLAQNSADFYWTFYFLILFLNPLNWKTTTNTRGEIRFSLRTLMVC